jgi:hypothetical protein
VATKAGEQPIGELDAGDHVLAYDEATGTTGSYTVTAVLAHLDPALVHLTIDGERLETTLKHPFYTAERGWVAAGELHVGDRVRKLDGREGVVQAVAVEQRPQVMYNLTVAVAHTFFVGDGQWLVHNAKCPIKLGGRYKNLKVNPGEEIHHMPANSISPLSRGNGPAIRMSRADHKLTPSWGNSKAAKAYRHSQKALIDAGRFDDAIHMDIDSIQHLFGNKYDTNILEMIDSL